MPSTVFISYGRESGERVRLLAQDLGALGHQVWFDHEITGGQAWWDHILLKIQACSVFVYALSPESLDSPACRSEHTYAAKLGKSFLPVLVSEDVPADLLPPSLARVQYVDYRREDKEALKALARSLAALPPNPPLPVPLPAPPAAPISYLGSLADKVAASEPLSFQEQSDLLLRLKHGLSDTKREEHVRSLLRRLRSRDDLLARVADEIDTLLREAPAATLPGSTPPARAAASLEGGTDEGWAPNPDVPGADLPKAAAAATSCPNESPGPPATGPSPSLQPPTKTRWIKVHTYVQLLCVLTGAAAFLVYGFGHTEEAVQTIAGLLGFVASVFLGALSLRARFKMGVCQGWLLPVVATGVVIAGFVLASTAGFFAVRLAILLAALLLISTALHTLASLRHKSRA